MEKEKVLGFEVGASKLIALAGDTSGTVFSKITTGTKNSEATHDVLFDQLSVLYSRLSKKYKAKYIGMTFPGAISRKGIVVYAPNLPGWKGYDLLNEAQRKFGLKVFVENDANAQALAEKLYGYGRLYSNFIYLTIGTGIGGAIIIDNKLYSGHRGWAGELGHMIIQKNGPECGCGRYGCLEALASGKAIASLAEHNVQKGSMLYNKKGSITGKDIFDAWQSGDAFARSIVYEVATNLSIGIANIINIFDPEAIIVGGGITRNNEQFIKLVRGKVYKELGNYTRRVKIIRAWEGLVEKAPLAVVAYNLDLYK